MKTAEEFLNNRIETYNNQGNVLPIPEMYKVRFSDSEKEFITQCMDIYANQLKQKWISVTDRLPEYGVKVIAYKMGSASTARLVQTNKRDYWEVTAGIIQVGEDHSWMPLPEKPQENG